MIDRDRIATDWAARGFSCDLWIDAPGQRWEDFTHATDELVLVLEGEMEFDVRGCQAAWLARALPDKVPRMLLVRPHQPPVSPVPCRELVRMGLPEVALSAARDLRPSWAALRAGGRVSAARRSRR